MPLDHMLAANRIACQAECTSKKRALETLADLISSSVPSLSADEIFQQLFNRERLGSTGIGAGIAIPHCRFATEGVSLSAVMTLSQPIDFDAADGKPVDVLIAMLVPEEADNEHLQNLAKLAEAMQESDFANELRAAKTNAALFEAATAPFKT